MSAKMSEKNCIERSLTKIIIWYQMKRSSICSALVVSARYWATICRSPWIHCWPESANESRHAILQHARPEVHRQLFHLAKNDYPTIDHCTQPRQRLTQCVIRSLNHNLKTRKFTTNKLLLWISCFKIDCRICHFGSLIWGAPIKESYVVCVDKIQYR